MSESSHLNQSLGYGCSIGDKVAQLVRSRTSNQRVAGSITLWSVLGRDSLFHIASVYAAEKMGT